MSHAEVAGASRIATVFTYTLFRHGTCTLFMPELLQLLKLQFLQVQLLALQQPVPWHVHFPAALPVRRTTYDVRKAFASLCSHPHTPHFPVQLGHARQAENCQRCPQSVC
eukprot:365084-Chlamydomonas_euryale.AAC.8